MSITPQQIKAIHCVLHAKGLMHHKTTIVEAISNGRTSSSTGLTFEEAKALLLDLNKDTVTKADGEKMRKHIIAMAHNMGAITQQATVLPNGSIKQTNDYTSLNNWLLQYSYLHKKLDAYTYEELPKLVTQYKAVYADYLKNVK